MRILELELSLEIKASLVQAVPQPCVWVRVCVLWINSSFFFFLFIAGVILQFKLPSFFPYIQLLFHISHFNCSWTLISPSKQLCRTNIHVVIWFQGLFFVRELGCRWLVISFSLSVWEPIRTSRRTTASAFLPITLMASPRQFTIPVTGKEVFTYLLIQQPVHLVAVACSGHSDWSFKPAGL